jgi:hypothetical protein
VTLQEARDLVARATPEQEVLAHQYLYYVEAAPVIEDFEYDMVCRYYKLPGGGGSDRASDYPEATKTLAKALAIHHA